MRQKAKTFSFLLRFIKFPTPKATTTHIKKNVEKLTVNSRHTELNLSFSFHNVINLLNIFFPHQIWYNQ